MRSRCLTLPLLLCMLSVSGGQMSDKMPLMEYLPNGTTLTNVSIPTYDETLNPTSLFQADEVKVVDKKAGIMEVKNAVIKMLSDNEPMILKLKLARYFYQKGYLEAEETVKMTQGSMTISGTGACYDLKTKELFLKGPSRAFFMDRELARNIRLSLSTMLTSLSLSGAPPTAPSIEELSELRETARTADVTIRSAEREVAHETERLAHKAAQSDHKLQSFLNKTGQAELLVQQTGVPNPPKSESTTALKVPSGALTVSCDGGMYYDAEKGLFVCLKNVKVEEPRFTLECKDQLKIFLTPKQARRNDADDNALAAFSTGNVEEMVASGNVKLFYKNTAAQEPITATGETVHYDATKGEILIDGSGLPTIQQGNNFFEALAPTVWVKISKKGFTLGPGAKRTVYLAEDDD